VEQFKQKIKEEAEKVKCCERLYRGVDFKTKYALNSRYDILIRAAQLLLDKHKLGECIIQDWYLEPSGEKQ
jgi:hypothetical protein